MPSSARIVKVKMGRQPAFLLKLVALIGISLGVISLFVHQKTVANSFVPFVPTSVCWQSEPPVLLWVWEYSSDLRFIDPGKTGVAFLAAKIWLSADRILVSPRLQALKVLSGTYKVAVIRIETDKIKMPTLSGKQLDQLVFQVNEIVAQRPMQALQIDFDARTSQREFYKSFLRKLKAAMSPDMPLSITSLASWCLRDNWIADLPCDEVVPMFFSMGADRHRALVSLESDHGLANLSMQESLGLSIEEPDVLAALKRMTPHVYLFSKHGWSSSRAVTWVRTFESGGSNWRSLAKN